MTRTMCRILAGHDGSRYASCEHLFDVPRSDKTPGTDIVEADCAEAKARVRIYSKWNHKEVTRTGSRCNIKPVIVAFNTSGRPGRSLPFITETSADSEREGRGRLEKGMILEQ